MNNDLAYLFVAVFLLLLMTGFALAFASLFRPWMQVFLSGGRITLPTILAMRFRGLPVKAICDSYVMMLQCGFVVDIEEIQKAHQMGAYVDKLARAVCLAKQNDQSFDWDDLVATAIADSSQG